MGVAVAQFLHRDGIILRSNISRHLRPIIANLAVSGVRKA